MKEKDCQGAVEDVIYMSIAHKFSEVDVPMVRKLSECISDNTEYKELETIHSLEVQELVSDHLINILSLRDRSAVEGLTITKIDRLHLGRIYAASIMFGYFLKSVCFRRQMDTRLTRPQKDLQTVGYRANGFVKEQYQSNQESLEMQYASVESFITQGLLPVVGSSGYYIQGLPSALGHGTLFQGLFIWLRQGFNPKKPAMEIHNSNNFTAVLNTLILLHHQTSGFLLVDFCFQGSSR